MLPAPREVCTAFSELMASDHEDAVAYLHDLGVSSGYIKTQASDNGIHWTNGSSYGDLECTINLSKPEKDPLVIAADAATNADAAAVDAESADAKSPPNTSLTRLSQKAPQCDLCWENEGFQGTSEFPAKPGLRIVPILLGGETWGLHYSPYAYFTEHCIAISEQHRPMRINESCFERLLDFVDAFPFYFIGSNADLPIVGGSILSHDHFQGGRHVFPLMQAPIEREVCLQGALGKQGVQCGIVRWPASVLRLVSEDRVALSRVASRILSTWSTFSNEPCGIIAFDGTQHNTLSPIVRKTESVYTMDLVFRNNRTDAQHPWGIFHPDESMHHIKKENIGLIEIMGMAILPPRLAEELPLVQLAILEAVGRGLSPVVLTARLEDQRTVAHHAAWATDVYTRRASELSVTELRDSELSRIDSQGPEYPAFLPSAQKNELHPIIQQEVSRVFVSILETTGVFKCDATGRAGWDSFVEMIA